MVELTRFLIFICAVAKFGIAEWLRRPCLHWDGPIWIIDNIRIDGTFVGDNPGDSFGSTIRTFMRPDTKLFWYGCTSDSTEYESAWWFHILLDPCLIYPKPQRVEKLTLLIYIADIIVYVPTSVQGRTGWPGSPDKCPLGPLKISRYDVQ